MVFLAALYVLWRLQGLFVCFEHEVESTKENFQVFQRADDFSFEGQKLRHSTFIKFTLDREPH